MYRQGAFGDFSNHGSHGNLDEEVYDVRKLYATEGFAQRVARNDNFSNMTLP